MSFWNSLAFSMIHRMLAIWSQLNFTLQQCSMKEERSDILKNHRGNILPLLFTYIFSSLFWLTNLKVEIEKFAGSLGPLLQIESTNAKQEVTIWKLYKCIKFKKWLLNHWKDLLEKEMTIHSSTVAARSLWTEEPGRLQSMGSQGVRHDSVTETQQQPLHGHS